MYWAQEFIVDIKCAKGNKTGQQNFPGYLLKLPLLLNSHTKRVNYKQQKQNSMNWSHYLRKLRCDS